VAGGAGGTAAGNPADDARGQGDLPAAVHAGAAIFAAGVEIHDPGASYLDDSDLHAGAPLPGGWVAGPSAEFLAAAAAEADAAGSALSGGILDLAAVEPATSDELVQGRCILLPRADETTIVGSAPAAAGPLVVVAQGDAVIGQPGERVEMDGGLVVCGHLRVRGSLGLNGFLHAGSLEIAGSAAVTIPSGWRSRPLAGAVLPVIVESGR
jgi:hypothetical protein